MQGNTKHVGNILRANYGLQAKIGNFFKDYFYHHLNFPETEFRKANTIFYYISYH